MSEEANATIPFSVPSAFSVTHFSPVTAMKAGQILAARMTLSCLACCVFYIISIPFNCSDTALRVARSMVGAKVINMFVLFCEFLAGTRLVLRLSMRFTYHLLIRRGQPLWGIATPLTTKVIHLVQQPRNKTTVPHFRGTSIAMRQSVI